MIIIVVDYIFLKTLVLTTDNDTKMIYNLEDCRRMSIGKCPTPDDVQYHSNGRIIF